MNIDKAVTIARLIALLSLSFLFISFGIIGLRINKALPNTIQLADKDLVDVKNLIVHADMATDDARHASAMELKELPILTAKANQTLDSVNVVLSGTTETLASVRASMTSITADSAQLTSSATATLEETRTAVASIQPLLEAATLTVDDVQPVLDQATTTLVSTNKLISDPNLTKTLVNVQSTTADVAGVAKDGREWVHNELHPSTFHKFLSGVENVVEIGSHFVIPF
jgi:hypothetical protein